jgi:hypothetical protein
MQGSNERARRSTGQAETPALALIGLILQAARQSFNFRDFSFRGFRRRTPGPPPFSSMNSTPAASKAWRNAASFASVIVARHQDDI